MAQVAVKPWTMDEFFAWQERQPHRYELIDGFPVRMRAGVRRVHDQIVVNLLGELRSRLRGSRCAPFSGEHGIETLRGQIRRPDVGIDCAGFDANAFKAGEPRMVAEVLSPSTRDFDTFDKLNEYKTVETLDYILYVEPNAAEGVLWSRRPDRGWDRERLTGLDRSVDMPALGVTLPMAEIYDGVVFPPPRQPPEPA